ncbi:MAG TPA: tetratricopeptide repeat protein [Alphaproteobacteria bacterium]|nr:tetratricopeptide repeat protein [Alphaproteobacteria bacterium]
MSHLQADGNHGDVSVRSWPVVLALFGAISLVGGGCASNNTPQALMGEYKKILERQKAGMAFEDDVTQKLPEMTAAEYERLGDTYLRQGNINMAYLQYDKALRMEPQQVRVRYKVGLLFLRRGSPDEALKEFQAILQHDTTFALAYEGIGQVLLQKANYDEAELYFRHALALSPELWQCHNFLGILYDRQQRFDEAIAEYRAALALQPAQGFLLNNLGMSYYLKGDYEGAVQAFMEALRTAPAQNRIHNNLGLALAKLGRYDAALEAFKNAGDDAKAYNNLGMIYLGEKRYQEAIAAFEKAVQLSPSYYAKANENLKVAKQALAEAASVSMIPRWGPTSPSPSAPLANREPSTSERQPPNPRPTTSDRRSEIKHTSPATEAALSIQVTDASGSYTVQVHSFRTQAKVDRVVSHYRQRGYHAFSAPQQGSEGEPRWQRIFIGRFATKTDAEAFGRHVSLGERLTDFLVVRGSWADA